jgi:hypothetical protein
MRAGGRLTVVGLGPGARAEGFMGEVHPAQLRSSISASLPGRAQGYFSHEVGSVQLACPYLPNNENRKKERWIEMRISEVRLPNTSFVFVGYKKGDLGICLST